MRLGICATCHLKVWQSLDTLEFLERCHRLGAAGIQAVIRGDIPKIRARAEELGIYIEAMVPLDNLEQAVKDAAAVGAVAMRAASLGTRRYETFHSLAGWREFVARSEKELEAALPVLDKYKIPLGLENHKDWTADEMAALMKKYSSEYFGVCLDFGNNISLLDDPMDFVEKLAPYTVTTHLKNIAVKPDADGFLLSEVPLDQGFLDLPRIIARLPKVNLVLEMITRDPLKVPCLMDQYWATFPDRSGLYLARTLKLVEEKSLSHPIPRVSDASEEENIIACLRCADTEPGTK